MRLHYSNEQSLRRDFTNEISAQTRIKFNIISSRSLSGRTDIIYNDLNRSLSYGFHREIQKDFIEKIEEHQRER